MLKYFFENETIDEVSQVMELLNIKKKRIENLEFDAPFHEYEQAHELFSRIKDIARDIGDEKLANAQFVAKCYFHLFGNLAVYFTLLKDKEYRKSWDKLQDCLNEIYQIGKFTKIENRFEITGLYDLLSQYECLYPYHIFASSEYVITESECSICRKPMNSLGCPHIKGKLYWGEMACEHILKIQTINAVALVTNPVDKRCIMEVAEESQTAKFTLLEEFLKLAIYPFQCFEMQNNVIMKRNHDIKKLGANEKCSCGSGKKFKHCCSNKMYYEHHAYKVILGEKIEFQIV